MLSSPPVKKILGSSLLFSASYDKGDLLIGRHIAQKEKMKEVMIMEQSDLQYFRNLLEKMLDEIQEKGQSTLNDMSGSAQVYADPADRASQESDQFFTLRLRDRDRKLISKVQAALERIDDGSYGICEECGEEISIPRLKARPVTTLCIECKSHQEEEERLGQK